MMNPSAGKEMNPFHMQHQSLCDVLIVAKFDASNNNEVQVSIASSPSNITRDRDTLPLFPTCSSSEDGEESTHVIKVVPHNAQSAMESVARIFESIREERHQPKGLFLFDPIKVSGLSVRSDLHGR